MTKWMLIAIFMLVSLGPVSADATMIEGDSSGIFQRWTDEVRMPTPLELEVRAGSRDECGVEFGGDSANPACVYLPDTVVITRPHWINRWTFYHEMGHVFDAEEMTDFERARFLTLIRLPGRAWDYSEPGVDIHETSPREFFADAYAECAMTGVAPTKVMLFRALPMKFGPVWIEGPARWEQICRLIKATGSQI